MSIETSVIHFSNRSRRANWRIAGNHIPGEYESKEVRLDYLVIGIIGKNIRSEAKRMLRGPGRYSHLRELLRK